MRMSSSLYAGIGVLAAVATSSSADAAQIQLLMPLGRAAYQTNEVIDLSVVRSDTHALAAGPLALSVTGADGSKMSFTFPVGAVALSGGSARTTENLHLSGWLLRPGKYTVDVASDGASASTAFAVYAAVRD